MIKIYIAGPLGGIFYKELGMVLWHLRERAGPKVHFERYHFLNDK